MYHIKNDKRAYMSAELISSGLLELIKTVPFEQITISDIQRVSTVSRSTFYRNFDCIEDVLMLLCDRSFDAAIKRAEETGEEIRIAVFRYWFENVSLLETIVKIHRTDILVESLRRSEQIKLKFRPYIKDETVFDYFSGAAAIIAGCGRLKRHTHHTLSYLSLAGAMANRTCFGRCPLGCT